MNHLSDVWIVIPAFNEGKVIAKSLSQLQKTPFNVVIVDDGSEDDTVEKALQFPVIVLRHINNLGQGAALQTGITYALSQPGTAYIVTFDSDGQHDYSDIPKLLEPLKNNQVDVALGSRFMSGGQATNIDLAKLITLRIALIFTKWTTGLNLTDTHNGMRAFTASTAARLSISQNRMAHATEILHWIARSKLRYCEVPVTVVYTEYSRKKGQSILNSFNILWEIISGNLR